MTYAAIGAEFVVNSSTVRSQAESESTVLANGNILVVWRESDVGSSANILVKARMFSPDGAPLGAEFTVTGAGGGIFPTVTGLADGGFVVTWQSFGTIRGRVFDANGAATTAAFDISPVSVQATNADVTALEDGGFAVSWTDTRTSGGDVSRSGVHSRVYEADGTAGADVLLNTATVGNQAETSIAGLPGGGFVATWTDRGDPLVGKILIKARLMDANGNPTGPEIVVNASSQPSGIESSVTALADGKFAISWYENAAHRVQLFDASGQAIGGVASVPSNLSGVQTGPDIVALAEGGFALAWVTNIAPLSDGSGKSIFVQVFDAQMQPVGEPMLVNQQSNGDQTDPSLAALPDGGFVVTWTDLNAADNGNDNEVMARIFKAAEPVTIVSDGGGDSAEITAAENGVSVTQIFALSGGSAEGLTYSIVGGADAANFLIDPDTGVLIFLHIPDYEALHAAGDTTFEVVVRASNGILSDTQALSVTVTDVNEAPVIVSNSGGTSAGIRLSENASFVTTVAAIDPEGDAVTYSISGGPDAELFAIDANTGTLTFIAAPDYEAPTDSAGNNFYSVQVSASDGVSARTQYIQISVENVNEGLAITSGGGADEATYGVTEGAASVATIAASDLDGDAVTYAIVGGADAGLFAIDPATGALRFVTAPDFEAPQDADGDNRYEVLVRASDGTFGDTQAISVVVGNANEAPVITSSGGEASAMLLVAENQTAVTSLTATDPDGGAPTLSIIGGADAALFAIDPATGMLRFSSEPDAERPADADADNIYDVVIAASDGSLIDTQALSIKVVNVNEGPTITSGGGGSTAAVSVAENNSLVMTVTAADPEGTPLTYSIAGADAALFTIDAASGVLTFKSAPNFEAPSDGGGDNVYDLVVRASDGTLTDTQALRISVTNTVDGSTVNGTKNADTLNGTNAEDTISGFGGHDTLSGSGGADQLFGGEGNDTLTGGAGADRLSGGTGSDRFVFTSASDSLVGAADLITDFSRSEKDRISVTGIDANSGVAGDQNFAFIGTSAFSGTAGQLRFEQSGGLTTVFGDTNGDKIADFAIQVTGSIAFTSGDFLL